MIQLLFNIVYNIFFHVTNTNIVNHNIKKILNQYFFSLYLFFINLFKKDEVILPKTINKISIIPYEEKYKTQISFIKNNIFELEQIKKLNNYIILEYTPIGNILMYFNYINQCFEYYSDKEIPTRYILPVIQKYIITTKHKCIYYDIHNDTIEELETKKKNIESLNVTATHLYSTNTPTTNTTTTTEKKKNIIDNSDNVFLISKKRTLLNKIESTTRDKKQNYYNKYIWIGKIQSFDFLKIKNNTIREIHKRPITYLEFKKKIT